MQQVVHRLNTCEAHFHYTEPSNKVPVQLLQATQWALRDMESERGPMDNKAVMADQTTVLGRIPADVRVAAVET